MPQQKAPIVTQYPNQNKLVIKALWLNALNQIQWLDWSALENKVEGAISVYENICITLQGNSNILAYKC